MGSRGDVQPFVALARGLLNAGHKVTLGTAPLFEDFVRSYNIPFAPLDDEYIRLADTPEGREALEGGGSSLSLIRKVKPMIRRMLDDTIQAAEGADLIVYHPKALAGSHLGEKWGVPYIMSMPLPLYSPTSEFAMPVVSIPNLGGFVNRLTYVATRMATLPYQGVINDWREQLGLAPRRWWHNELKRPDGSLAPILYSFSPHVISPPADWSPNAHAVGYWTLPQPDNWTPSAELDAFLNAGEPPIYIGFGSMTGTRASEKTRIILDALAQVGVRGLLATGWGGLQANDIPDNVHVIESAPHDWLFKRVAAVVHHGGAGTTAAGLRAGLPTLICPFFGDQPFWGKRVHQLGVGPEPIPQKKLSVENLTEALHRLTGDDAMRQQAQALGNRLRAEDGVANAVTFIETYMQR